MRALLCLLLAGAIAGCASAHPQTSNTPARDTTNAAVAGPSGCRVDTGAVQDLPYGAGGDLPAQPGEFALDAAVSPGWVLGGEA